MTKDELALLKKHCRIDYDTDDDLLARYYDTARAKIIQDTGRTEDELTAANGGEFPPQLEMAVWLLTDHWYDDDRAGTSSTQKHVVPYSITALVRPFVKLSDSE